MQSTRNEQRITTLVIDIDALIVPIDNVLQLDDLSDPLGLETDVRMIVNPSQPSHRRNFWLAPGTEAFLSWLKMNRYEVCFYGLNLSPEKLQLLTELWQTPKLNLISQRIFHTNSCTINFGQLTTEVRSFQTHPDSNFLLLTPNDNNFNKEQHHCVIAIPFMSPSTLTTLLESQNPDIVDDALIALYRLAFLTQVLTENRDQQQDLVSAQFSPIPNHPQYTVKHFYKEPNLAFIQAGLRVLQAINPQLKMLDFSNHRLAYNLTNYSSLTTHNPQHQHSKANDDFVVNAAMQGSPPPKLSDALIKVISPYGFSYHDVPGDGSCFYHAIYHQLVSQGVARSLGIKSALHLRLIGKAFIFDNIETFMPFLGENFNFDDLHQSHRQVEEFDIIALTLALKTTIVIMRSDDANPKIYRAKDGALCFVAYNVKGGENNHYGSLMVKQRDSEAMQRLMQCIAQTDCVAEFLPEATLEQRQASIAATAKCLPKKHVSFNSAMSIFNNRVEQKFLSEDNNSETEAALFTMNAQG